MPRIPAPTLQRLLALLLIAICLGSSSVAHAMLWKGRRQSSNVEDLRHIKDSEPTIEQVELKQILVAWEKSRAELIHLGTAAQQKKEIFSSCPRLKATRGHYVNLKENLESPQLLKAQTSIRNLEQQLKVESGLVESADACTKGFASVDAQLAMQQLKISSARTYYWESAKGTVNAVRAIDKAMAPGGITEKLGEPGNCAQFTDVIAEKVRQFASAHNTISLKLESYAQKIQSQRDNIARSLAASGCDSLGTLPNKSVK